MEVRKTEMKLREVVTECYYLCDKCGEKISTGAYDAFEFTFEYKTGSAYPEGGNGDKKTLDLCEKCAPKAIKLLEDNGFKVQESEWDI
jgi:hypothetical protein